ncbi:uncharacterized protein GJ701_016139 [Geothlypis trichas]
MQVLCPGLRCHLWVSAALQASRETLLSAVSFLKRKDLKQLLQTDQMWRFAECLLAEDRSRAAEHLRLALPYLQSAQEPLREAAVRFMAFQDMTDDTSPAVSCLALQALYILLAVQSIPSSRLQKMRDRLRRLWKSRPFLCGRG